MILSRSNAAAFGGLVMPGLERNYLTCSQTVQCAVGQAAQMFVQCIDAEHRIIFEKNYER